FYAFLYVCETSSAAVSALSLHDALPICHLRWPGAGRAAGERGLRQVRQRLKTHRKSHPATPGVGFQSPQECFNRVTADKEAKNRRFSWLILISTPKRSGRISPSFPAPFGTASR